MLVFREVFSAIVTHCYKCRGVVDNYLIKMRQDKTSERALDLHDIIRAYMLCTPKIQIQLIVNYHSIATRDAFPRQGERKAKATGLRVWAGEANEHATYVAVVAVVLVLKALAIFTSAAAVPLCNVLTCISSYSLHLKMGKRTFSFQNDDVTDHVIWQGPTDIWSVEQD